jgi:putative membrane protein
MKNYIIKWFVNTVGLIVTAHIVPGIHIADYRTAILAALILALLNVFIKPFLIIVTLPINILSLGVFTLFINTFLLYAASGLVSGFIISGFWSAFLGALCLSVVSALLNTFIRPAKIIKVKHGQGKPFSRSVRDGAIEAEIVEKDKKFLK